MASELYGNSISCPDAGWTMLGPGKYGPDVWAIHGAEACGSKACSLAAGGV